MAQNFCPSANMKACLLRRPVAFYADGSQTGWVEGPSDVFRHQWQEVEVIGIGTVNDNNRADY